MGKPTIQERAWLEYTINDHLVPALEAAQKQLSDLEHLRTCESAGCDYRYFDARDPRALVGEFDICPACEIEHSVEKARAALAKAEAWEARVAAKNAGK